MNKFGRMNEKLKKTQKEGEIKKDEQIMKNE